MLWVHDSTGNNGKTFLANYLNILYGFSLYDGSINCRDIAGLFDCNTRGFCFDVSRASRDNFNYTLLENLKNGYLISGKYLGKIIRFNVLPVAVFANFYPNRTLLSQDRWKIVTLEEGILVDLNKSTIVSPCLQFPFVCPTKLPNLSDIFSRRAFMEANLSEYKTKETTTSTSSIISATDQRLRNVESQVPGV